MRQNTIIYKDIAEWDKIPSFINYIEGWDKIPSFINDIDGWDTIPLFVKQLKIPSFIKIWKDEQWDKFPHI